MSKTHKRILKSGASGVVASVIDLSMLLVMVELFGVQLALAVFLCASAGAVASFLVNKYWAFGDSSPFSMTQVLTFALVALGSSLGLSLIVQLLSVGAGVPYLASKAIGALLLFVAWTYPAQSRLVFVNGLKA